MIEAKIERKHLPVLRQARTTFSSRNVVEGETVQSFAPRLVEAFSEHTKRSGSLFSGGGRGRGTPQLLSGPRIALRGTTRSNSTASWT